MRSQEDLKIVKTPSPRIPLPLPFKHVPASNRTKLIPSCTYVQLRALASTLVHKNEKV